MKIRIPDGSGIRVKPKTQPAEEMAKVVIERAETQSREKYEGETTVRPSTEREITLETREKIVREDITVEKIYFSETSNAQGGETVYIG